MQWILTALLTFFLATNVMAASSTSYESERISARLITAEEGVGPGSQTISAALEVTLASGWKTYWKSPGQVGYPPELDWRRAYNVKDTEFLWPAPTRFEAFDIENYGYEHKVTFPIKVMLSEGATEADLIVDANLLVCADLCVPEQFSLVLSLFDDAGVDPEAASLIAAAIEQIPEENTDDGLRITGAHIDPARQVLSVSFKDDLPLSGVQVFPDLGLSAAFGAPEIELNTAGLSGVARLPILAIPETLPPLDLVVSTESAAVAATPSLSETPLEGFDGSGLLAVIFAALLGGVILNVMPCVLPVLSIKLTSALKAQDQSPARIRAGFGMSALGVIAFMWALAGILAAIKLSGGQVGWGIQFQSPLFLTVMATIVTLFAANMLGLFEITLPQSWNTALADADGRPGLLGDFGTGALAAVLATPCSAPFLGTAITFALAGGLTDIFVIFTALGIGLALPYLLVALRPSLVQALPRPGRWMLVVKWVMGGLLALTTLWLLSVLSGVAGSLVAMLVAACLATALLGIANAARMRLLRAGVVASLIAALAIPFAIAPPSRAAETSGPWTAFSEAGIAEALSNDKLVFVDVTADWCLTCKTNKSLVLDREQVMERLTAENTVAMRADWTRPDPAILSYLQANDRFGIPFNIIYGPGAPKGIALPEILTQEAVLAALERAQGS